MGTDRTITNITFTSVASTGTHGTSAYVPAYDRIDATRDGVSVTNIGRRTSYTVNNVEYDFIYSSDPNYGFNIADVDNASFIKAMDDLYDNSFTGSATLSNLLNEFDHNASSSDRYAVRDSDFSKIVPYQWNADVNDAPNSPFQNFRSYGAYTPLKEDGTTKWGKLMANLANSASGPYITPSSILTQFANAGAAVINFVIPQASSYTQIIHASFTNPKIISNVGSWHNNTLKSFFDGDANNGTPHTYYYYGHYWPNGSNYSNVDQNSSATNYVRNFYTNAQHTHSQGDGSNMFCIVYKKSNRPAHTKYNSFQSFDTNLDEVTSATVAASGAVAQNTTHVPAYIRIDAIGDNGLTITNVGRLQTKTISGVGYDFIWSNHDPFSTEGKMFHAGIDDYYGNSSVDLDFDDLETSDIGTGTDTAQGLINAASIPRAHAWYRTQYFDSLKLPWTTYKYGMYLIPYGEYCIGVTQRVAGSGGTNVNPFAHQTAASIAGTKSAIQEFFNQVDTLSDNAGTGYSATFVSTDANYEAIRTAVYGTNTGNVLQGDVYSGDSSYCYGVIYKTSKRNSDYISPSQAEATSAGITTEKVTTIKEATIEAIEGKPGKAIPATVALDAIKESLTGNKAQINRKRKAAIKLLFAGDNASTAKQLVIPRAKLALPNTFVQAKVVAVKPGTPSSPPEPVSVADMSDDEGFYSALADGEIFLVSLPSGNTYTFTRTDSGSEERYTVDISGGSWTGISVKKLTGCANLDTSDPSASGSFLVENDVVGIDGRRFFIGSVGDGGSEIFTGGDPYITPMYGNTYKLPVDEKIYRMFDNNKETDRFLINVEMKKPKKEYAETLNKKILALNPDADPNSVFFSEKMSFMTRVFIQCGNQGLIYDLEQWKLVDKTDNCHVVIEDMDVNRPTIEEYEDEKRITRRMVFKTKTMGNMIVYVEKYENPQIRSGLNVSQNTNTTNFVGALIRQSKPESIQVNSLVSREMLGEDALVEYEADTLSIEYFGNVKTGQKGIRVFR